MRNIKLFLLAANLSLFMACKKEKFLEVEGIVETQSGCFPDSWRVTIMNPDPKHHRFLCEVPPTVSSIPDCSYKVFIQLPANLAIPGKHIIFSDISIVPSCLSSSIAPKHISASTIRGN